MHLCPICASPLATDALTVEVGGVPMTHEWVAGCTACGWQPHDDDQRQDVPPFSTTTVNTPRIVKE